ncbi:hypothetical protein I6E09_05720 [Mediterraneibacter glycyrrhizinilyticus]|uniref:hypothetical protein n=1 Tax=Mediterraneibacter glycyrrhizinilyticus TaxID=342942 RepID=UPI002658D62D|nr:hypothetical protein [Mediterraneibacter glycyrrhizinilyticus]MCF2568671.1 hypothetical protein [Mediterraneibacter glycyrrhizinilyticus]
MSKEAAEAAVSTLVRLCEWRGRVVADVARKEAAEAAVSTLVRLCEWRGRVVADVARKEAAEAVVSAERDFANGAAELLRTWRAKKRRKPR